MKLFTEHDFLWKTNLETQYMLVKSKRILSWHFLSYLSHLVANQNAIQLSMVEPKWDWMAHTEDSRLLVGLLALKSLLTK